MKKGLISLSNRWAFVVAVGVSVFLFPGASWAEDPGVDFRPGTTTDVESRGNRGELEHETLKVLSKYLTQAALHNSELEAAFYRWKAALEKIPQVKALPDPRFTFAYYIQSVETRVGPQQASFGLFQTFPWFGTLDLKENIATHEANALREQLNSLKLKIFYHVKSVFYEYAYLAQAVEITKEDIELLRYLESVTRARYTTGATPYSDVLRTQVQLGRLEDHLNTLRELRGPIMAKLAAAMNMPIDTQLPWPPGVPVMLICITEEELFKRLPENNPQLKRYDYLEAKEKAGIALARKGYYPEFTFGIQDIITGSAVNPLTPDSGQDAIIASVNINIPLWLEKRRASIREGEAKLRSAEKGGLSLKQTLSSDMAFALYKYRDAERKIDLYQNTLIPKADQALGATLEAFQTGSRTSFDLIEAEKTLLEFELSYVRALTDQAQMLAELEMLSGEEIPCDIHGVELPKHKISQD